MAKIFISYRRADNAAFAGRIYDRLTTRFGRRNVFKDVDDIPPGVEFPDYIQSSLLECQVVLAIIGPSWLGVVDAQRNRRLDDPADFVRIEIESALNLGLVLIPVLIDRASMPSADDLPESLRRLARINAIEVRNDPDFTRDAERLIAAIEHALSMARQTSRSGIRGGLSLPGSKSASPPVAGFSPTTPANSQARATTDAGNGANPSGGSGVMQTSPAKTASGPPGQRRRSERGVAAATLRMTRTTVALAGSALLLLVLAASGVAMGPSVVARLFTVERQGTVTVTTTLTRTATSTSTPTASATAVPAGFTAYDGLSGTYSIIAPTSWKHFAHPDNSTGITDYIDEFTPCQVDTCTYPPDVLVHASAEYESETDQKVISEFLQNSAYTSLTQTVGGISCTRGDFARQTPGGTDHTAVIVCRPKPETPGAYVYVFVLSDQEANFQSDYQKYFSNMLDSFNYSTS